MRLAERLHATRAQLLASRYMRPFAHLLANEGLWRFNRRSVTRGVGLGLLAGVVVPLGQSITAALLAIPLRANVAVAALMTFVTNPFTMPFFYAGAFHTGRWVLGADDAVFRLPRGDTTAELLRDAGDWLLVASGPMIVGFLVIGVVLAALGYGGALLAWRWRTTSRWRARARRRQAVGFGAKAR